MPILPDWAVQVLPVVTILAPALTTHADLPYVFGAASRSATVQAVRPSHLLMVAAFFMLVVKETGRIPVENHDGTLELVGPQARRARCV